jgi:cephalosporin-C deacetylase
VETAAAHPAVDSSRLAVTGGSQGGGVAIAAASLVSEVSILMADVPFLCHFSRALEITDAYPYQEIVAFCKTHRDKVDTVMHTLSYFDGMNFSARIKASALFSVGLLDDVCPPSTVFAAYNHLLGDKNIRIYRFNRHEGGENFQTIEKLNFIKSHWI